MRMVGHDHQTLNNNHYVQKKNSHEPTMLHEVCESSAHATEKGFMRMVGWSKLLSSHPRTSLPFPILPFAPTSSAQHMVGDRY